MKKAGLFVISLLLISLFSFVISVPAQETAPGLEQIPLAEELQQGQQQYEQYTTAQNKSDYLKQEWAKLLEKHEILGPIFKVLNSVFIFLSPLFKIVLGYDSLSWGFVFAVIIWLALFVLIYFPSSQLLNNQLFGGIASFAIITLIGLSGVIRAAVGALNKIITPGWRLWVSLGIMIILAFIFNLIGKQIKKWLKKLKKESEEVKTAEAQKIIQTRAESAKKELESTKDDWKPNFGNMGNR